MTFAGSSGLDAAKEVDRAYSGPRPSTRHPNPKPANTSGRCGAGDHLPRSCVLTERLRNPLPQDLLSVVAAVLTLALAISLALRRRVPFTALAISHCGSLHRVATARPERILRAGQSGLRLLGRRVRVSGAGSLGRAGDRCRRSALFCGTPGLDQLDAEMVEVLLVWLATWAVGYTVARRREEQDRARVAIARQVVAEERVRISRELHDLMGHTVNLLVVQAGAARLMLDKDPAMTRELLSGMERTGRETLADLDQVLATLRPDPAEPAEAGASSHPLGVAQLPELVDRFTDSGIDVRLSVEPTLAAARNVDLSDLPDRPRRAYEHAQARCSVLGDRRRPAGRPIGCGRGV